MAKKQADTAETQDTQAPGTDGTPATTLLAEAFAIAAQLPPVLSPASLKVLAYFPEHSDGANFHALQAVASLSQLGVTARVVHGSVFNEANQPVSRLVVELPETVAA